jgi:hypothetical protein
MLRSYRYQSEESVSAQEVPVTVDSKSPPPPSAQHGALLKAALQQDTDDICNLKSRLIDRNTIYNILLCMIPWMPKFLQKDEYDERQPLKILKILAFQCLLNTRNGQGSGPRAANGNPAIVGVSTE